MFRSIFLGECGEYVLLFVMLSQLFNIEDIAPIPQTKEEIDESKA